MKPENVLLDADGHVKLGDFGLAKAGIRQPCEGATSMCGTPEYMAPEVLSHTPYDNKVDIWSMGTVLYEMLTGIKPYSGNNLPQLLQNINSRALIIPENVTISKAATELLQNCLRRNPTERFSSKQFFGSDFLRDDDDTCNDDDDDDDLLTHFKPDRIAKIYEIWSLASRTDGRRDGAAYRDARPYI